MTNKTIRIGGAAGMWGDASLAVPQLLAEGGLDYIVGDYLAEITMSIMARARAANAAMGYATDFVTAVMKPNLNEIARQGVKVIANAGGVNVQTCADAVRALIAEQGLTLKVATVSGDDLYPRRDELAQCREMFSGAAFPAAERVASINAYLGAFPIAAALDKGADIVITGRCVDSAVTLGACIHEFGWGREDFDKLAQGSLAGHLLECGTQATGGNFTDWEQVAASLHLAGYPIAEIRADGEVVITKPQKSGGLVSVGTVAEQMLYEIGDPQAYLLPDVACDFSRVQLEQIGENRVRLSGAIGHGAPDHYKVSATYTDGWRAGQVVTFYGRDADKKARAFADSVFKRCAMMFRYLGLPDFSETSVEIIGNECHYGAARAVSGSREVDVKIAAKHASPKGAGLLLKELIGMGLTAPPGLTFFAGGRPKPSPVVRLFSTLLPKSAVQISVEVEGVSFDCSDSEVTGWQPAEPHSSPAAEACHDPVTVSLESLAWARSGDKGNKANIGVIARRAEFLPWIAASIDEQKVGATLAHFIDGDQQAAVQRFFMPGCHAFNFLINNVLGGGGVASLRADPQGKGYAQLLLAQTVQVPRELAEKYQLPVAGQDA